MQHWTEQADGSFLGAATDRALEWAGGDRLQLASVGFVAFLRDQGLDPFWTVDDWDVVAMNEKWLVYPILDVSTDHDKFLVNEKVESDRSYAVVRILEGQTPLIHILGVTGTLEQIAREPGPWPRAKFLRPLDCFLAAFRAKETA